MAVDKVFHSYIRWVTSADFSLKLSDRFASIHSFLGFSTSPKNVTLSTINEYNSPLNHICPSVSLHALVCTSTVDNSYLSCVAYLFSIFVVNMRERERDSWWGRLLSNRFLVISNCVCRSREFLTRHWIRTKWVAAAGGEKSNSPRPPTPTEKNDNNKTSRRPH